jgi:predicted adenylyl cyclase CyaB
VTGPEIPYAAPRSNIELKARAATLDPLREIARRLATAPPETQHQIDTYFCCRQGRLKLREINGRRAELIWYERPDQQQPKPSRYGLVAIEDPAGLKQALAATVGIRVTVEKRREIYLHDNVRIHLDQVRDLGSFLEFEAVLGPRVDQRQGVEQVARLMEQFSIREEDLCTGSYAEMREPGYHPGQRR